MYSLCEKEIKQHFKYVSKYKLSTTIYRDTVQTMLLIVDVGKSKGYF